MRFIPFIFISLSLKLYSQDIQYPYHFTFTGNPLVRLHGAADPDVHVWNDTVWMYCSQDHAGGYENMDGYHAFSSPDLINWTDHGEILHSREVDWGLEEGGYMWAPGAAYKNGKYYLYFPHRDKSNSWRIGVAISDKPQGPFTDIGAPLEGISGIDPAIFIDDDGEAYIYNNSAIVAKLKPNMVELAESPKKINYDKTNKTTDNYTQGFAEGSYMHKKDGIYYYSYTNWHNNVHQGFYAVGDNPYGPFEWKGPMAPKPQGAQDHHSIIEFKEKWYYFYHIAISDIPENKDGQGRIACFDRLFYNEDGSIKMIKHTRNVQKYPPSQKAFNNMLWQFPGDTLAAWQFDYFNEYDYFNDTYGDTLFALDSAQTIGIYGCNNIAGFNIRKYQDAANYQDMAQFNWDSISQTFVKNGQWLEYSSLFQINEPYQLLLRARNGDANFKLTAFKNQNDTVFYKEFNLKEDFKNLGGANDQTDWFLSKSPLIGLWGINVIRFDWFDNIGESGIFGEFSFIQSQLDVTPPEWYFVSIGIINKGEDIIVMTTEDAKVYIVPEGTLPETVSIEEAAVVIAEVSAFSQFNITTANLNPDNYIAYAIDSSGNISKASSMITLQTTVNTPLISKKPELEVTYYSLNKSFSIKSSNQLRQVDIYTPLGKKIESKLCQNNNIEFKTTGMSPGIYFIKTISSKGILLTEKIIIR